MEAFDSFALEGLREETTDTADTTEETKTGETLENGAEEHAEGLLGARSYEKDYLDKAAKEYAENGESGAYKRYMEKAGREHARAQIK